MQLAHKPACESGGRSTSPASLGGSRQGEQREKRRGFRARALCAANTRTETHTRDRSPPSPLPGSFHPPPPLTLCANPSSPLSRRVTPVTTGTVRATRVRGCTTRAVVMKIRAQSAATQQVRTQSGRKASLKLGNPRGTHEAGAQGWRWRRDSRRACAIRARADRARFVCVCLHAPDPFGLNAIARAPSNSRLPPTISPFPSNSRCPRRPALALRSMASSACRTT